MALTPMMCQYLEIKEKCKDCILFFRLGDFYEMFFEDAETASRELELVLTGRDCGLEKRAPMCGIPYHAANTYISRLVNKGYKIAICEQLEDPSLAKGIVKRDIIKIITPGTYMDSSFLSDKENNYLMSLYIDKSYNNFGICFADISTGEFNCTTGEFSISSILDEISKFDPKEIIIQEKINKDLLKKIKEKFNLPVTEYNNIYFEENSLENLKNQFSNKEYINFTDTLLNACNGLLKYILHTQKMSLSNITELNYYNLIDYLNIDINTRKNLELTEALNNKSKKGSLLWILDKTNTAMGARELKKWVEQPLLNKKQIENRLEAIEELMDNFSLHDDLKEALKDIYDIERLTGKISSKSVNAKELISLKNSIGNLPKIKLSLNKFKSNLLIKMFNELDELKDIYSLLDNAIDDNPSLSVKEGNIIKLGFNKEVDELKSIKSHGKEWIAKLETKEKEITGIKSLKIGYNKVFGYYIDVTKTNINLVPEDRYIRKQTLSNSERYITEELKEMEEKILGAEEKLINLEYQLFVEVRDKIETEIIRLKSTAKIVSRIDCLSSLATIALDNNYSKPELNNKGYIKIEGGRHPVVEKMIPNGSFVQNDTFLNREENQLLLITGPNMAGKSTYMRQVALIVLMAQMGSFVPCEFADISICDKIFTRIGASDDLASGKSTFMVEMSEVSNILKNATKNSLILLDEVGRGTSTYDGLSIAWAVIEYICTNPELKCKTLFATHYHELTKLEHSIQGIKNYSIAVKKVDNDIIFLRKIIEGGTDKSYGIEVAKLAGLPNEVLNRANVILNSIESSNKNLSSNFESVLGLIEDSIINENNNELKDSNIELNKNNKDKLEEKTIKIENLEKQDELEKEKEKEELIKTESNDNIDDKVMEPIQIDFTEIEKENLINKIKNIDILNMTPMEGFNKLYELIQKVKSL